MYIPLSQEKPLNRSVNPPSHLKRQKSRAWHNYKDLHQINRICSKIAGQALIFYGSINDQYSNCHIQHQIQEELLTLVIKFTDNVQLTPFSRTVEVEQ